MGEWSAAGKGRRVDCWGHCWQVARTNTSRKTVECIITGRPPTSTTDEARCSRRGSRDSQGITKGNAPNWHFCLALLSRRLLSSHSALPDTASRELWPIHTAASQSIQVGTQRRDQSHGVGQSGTRRFDSRPSATQSPQLLTDPLLAQCPIHCPTRSFASPLPVHWMSRNRSQPSQADGRRQRSFAHRALQPSLTPRTPLAGRIMSPTANAGHHSNCRSTQCLVDMQASAMWTNYGLPGAILLTIRKFI